MNGTVNGAIGLSFVGKLVIPLLLAFNAVGWDGDQTALIYSALAGVDAMLLAYGVHLKNAGA